MTELRVFLASPSDVARERELAREVIERLNQQVGPQLDVLLRPVGWEHVRIGFGRAQSLINPEVARADVFVGILGKRWGTPTGEASSGFAEEFEAIRARAERGEPVEVLLFVRQLTGEELEDPGDQLKQMLAFREEIKSLVMFRVYATPEDFSRELALELIAVATARAAGHSPSPAGSALEPAATVKALSVPETPGDAPDTAPSAAAEQILAVLDVARGATTSDAAEPPVTDNGEHYDAFSIARMNLLARAWMSKTATNEPMTVHEINRLYNFRDRLHAGKVEQQLMLRTMCSYPAVAPGWGLLRLSDAEAAEALLFEAALNKDAAVRIGALGMLEPAGLEQWVAADADRSIAVAAAFLVAQQDGESEPLEALIRLLEGLEDAEQELIALATAEEDPSRWARNALIRRRVETDPAEALELADTVAIEASAIAALHAALAAASREVVAGALGHPRAAIRRLALEVLAARGELTADEARIAMGDADRDVRVAALELLVALGETPPAEAVDQVVAVPSGRNRWEFSDSTHRAELAVARSKPVELLLAEVNYLSLVTVADYQVLAQDHFDRFGEQVRRDLADGFAAFAAESRDAWIARLTHGMEDQLRANTPPGPQQEDTVRQGLEFARAEAERRMDELGKYSKSSFGGAALAGIALHGEADDAPVVRRWLEEIDALNRPNAIRALARVGGPEDVDTLVAQAASTYGESREVATQAALALAPGATGVARRLAAERNDELAVLAARYLAAEYPDGVDEELLFVLLNHEQDDVRLAGVRIALAISEKEGLRSLLERYLDQSYRYYNVIVALDRAIFAPSWMEPIA